MQRVRAETAWLLVTKRDMFLPTQLDPVDQFDPYSCHFLLVVTVISGDSGYYKWSLCVSAVLFVENTEIPEITSGRMCFCPAEEVVENTVHAVGGWSLSFAALCSGS